MARQGTVTKTFTHNGKRYYVYGKTDTEANEKAAAKLALLKAGVRQASGNYTVSEWAMIWLNDYKSTVGKGWYKSMLGLINNYISKSIGDKLVRDVKPHDIVRMLGEYTYMSESHGKKLLIVTKQIFDSAEENGIILSDPARRVKLPQYKESESHRTITPFERELTVRTANKHQKEGLFFLLMLYCGLRPQEVCRLQYGDIDNGTLHVRRALKSDGTTGAPKSKTGTRDIPIPDALIIPKGKSDELIFTSSEGRPLTKTGLKRLWKRFKRLMEIENGATLFRNRVVSPVLPDDLVPYCYRHTYCTDLQDAGVPITVASRLMGHSDIKITAKIYTHHSQESFDDARDKINAHLTP